MWAPDVHYNLYFRNWDFFVTILTVGWKSNLAVCKHHKYNKTITVVRIHFRDWHLFIFLSAKQHMMITLSLRSSVPCAIFESTNANINNAKERCWILCVRIKLKVRKRCSVNSELIPQNLWHNMEHIVKQGLANSSSRLYGPHRDSHILFLFFFKKTNFKKCKTILA